MKDSLEKHLGFWLRGVSNQVSNSFKKKLEAIDVGVAEWVVLSQLDDFVNLSPGLLAKKTGMTRGAMSKLLERLLSKNLIERLESADDRRFQEIKLTEAGKKLLPQLKQIADVNDQHFFGSLSDQERKHLLDILKKVSQLHALTEIPIN